MVYTRVEGETQEGQTGKGTLSPRLWFRLSWRRYGSSHWIAEKCACCSRPELVCSHYPEASDLLGCKLGVADEQLVA